MNNKPPSFLLLSALMVSAPLLLMEQAQAEIYKCVNAKEAVFYKDKPCPSTEIESKVKVAKAPKNGYIPAPFSPSDAEEEEQQISKKSLVIGENSLQNEAASKKEFPASQSNDKSLSDGVTDSSKNNNSTEMNSKKNTVASTDSPNSNATLSQATTSKPKKRLME